MCQIFLCLCLTVRICKNFFVFSNMIRLFYLCILIHCTSGFFLTWTMFIYLYLCIHFRLIVLAYCYNELTLFLNIIFHNIINHWRFCLRIIITLVKESKNKNKVILSLKKIIIGYQTGWENNSLVTFNNFKGYKGNYQLFINKNNSWFTLPG